MWCESTRACKPINELVAVVAHHPKQAERMRERERERERERDRNGDGRTANSNNSMPKHIFDTVGFLWGFFLCTAGNAKRKNAAARSFRSCDREVDGSLYLFCCWWILYTPYCVVCVSNESTPCSRPNRLSRLSFSPHRAAGTLHCILKARWSRGLSKPEKMCCPAVQSDWKCV